MPVNGHWSCIVHTMGLPLSMMRRMSFRERKPWLIQCRWMTSASLNSGNAVMSVPVLAKSTWNRLCFLNRLAFQMQTRSHTNLAFSRGDWGRLATVIWSVRLSRTSILAFTPLFFRASMRRLAAMAAPPMFSDVLIMSTLIRFSFVSSGGMALCAEIPL